MFPDSFHLGTLDVLLGALPELQPGVKVHSVMASLMDRLAKYAAADKAVMARLLDMKAFERFRDAIAHVITAQVRRSGGKHTAIRRSSTAWWPPHTRWLGSGPAEASRQMRMPTPACRRVACLRGARSRACRRLTLWKCTWR